MLRTTREFQFEIKTRSAQGCDHLLQVFEMSAGVLGEYDDIVEVDKANIPVIRIQGYAQGSLERHRGVHKPKEQAVKPILPTNTSECCLILFVIINWYLQTFTVGIHR